MTGESRRRARTRGGGFDGCRRADRLEALGAEARRPARAGRRVTGCRALTRSERPRPGFTTVFPANDVESFDGLVSQEATSIIGTAHKEWFTDREKLRSGFGYDGLWLEGGDPQAWEEGDMGWVRAIFRSGHPTRRSSSCNDAGLTSDLTALGWAWPAPARCGTASGHNGAKSAPARGGQISRRG